jgi:hypothetical protein
MGQGGVTALGIPLLCAIQKMEEGKGEEQERTPTRNRQIGGAGVEYDFSSLATFVGR